MYVLQDQPEQFQTVMGVTVQAVATLKDEHGGVVHIAVDDRCYVLFREMTDILKRCKQTAWWFREAVAVMQTLPLPGDVTVPTIKCTAQMNIVSPAELKGVPLRAIKKV